MAALSPDLLAAGFNEIDHRIRSSLKSLVEGVWLNAGSWRDADVDRMLNVVIPRVQGAQIQLATMTTAYVQALARVGDKREVAMVPVDRAEILGARGVDADVVYRRPAVTMYSALAAGSTMTDAIKRGASRLVSLAMTDLQLAKTHQERRSYVGSGFEYTIRTLTGRENCALCIIASTQRYRAKNLRPIHPGCDCGSRSVKADFDPGQVIDQALLEEIHGAILDQFGSSDVTAQMIDGLKQVSYRNGLRGADYTDLISVREHGEIGPLLTWRHQHFTGADDL